MNTFLKKLKLIITITIITICSILMVELICYCLYKNGFQVNYVHEENLRIERFDIFNEILSGQKDVGSRLKQLTQYLDEWGISKYEKLAYEVRANVPTETKDYRRLGRDGFGVIKNGHTLKKNFDKEITLFEKNSENVIYQARYTTNELGWRITDDDNYIKSGPSLIFLGCSFTFGEGLNNNQTFPYLLSEILGAQTYNYGVPGSSPSWMLKALLESKKSFIDPRDKNDKIVFYVYINDHFNRVIANSNYLEDEFRYRNEPYFYFEDNQLKHKNSFSEMNLFKGFLIRLLSKSYFMKVMRLSYPTIGKEQVKLFASIVNNIKSMTMKKDPTIKDFYVLVWPGNKYKNSQLIKQLDDFGIKTINYGDLDVFHLLKNRHNLKRDGHPSALTNDLLAFLLSKDIKEILNNSNKEN